MRHAYHVYILTNNRRTVLYTGVTNDLARRVGEHATASRSSFSGRYNVSRLMYFESFGQITDAIAREKQIKAGSRKSKLDLINGLNPEWRDLVDDLM